MDAYADYAYYTAVYGGTSIPAETFLALAKRASVEIDRQTLNRAGKVITEGVNTMAIDRIKAATCAIAEVIRVYSVKSESAGIASESIGDHSVKYTGADVLKELESNAIKTVAEMYLGLTGLMYIGIA